MRRLAVAVLALAGVADMAVAQGVQANVGRFYEDEGWTLYRLGVDRPLTGPLGTTVHGDYLRRVGDADGAFASTRLSGRGAVCPHATLSSTSPGRIRRGERCTWSG